MKSGISPVQADGSDSMSRSIYGIRMPGTIGDVINQLHGLRPLMASRAEHLIAQAVARIATDHHDKAILFGSESPEQQNDNYLQQAGKDVQNRIFEIERSNTRDPEVDTAFDVVICQDGVNVVLMTFTEHHDWFSDLLSLPGAENFCYRTGEACPEHINPEIRDMRRRTYERILSRDPHGRPAGCGVTLSFQKPARMPGIDAILSAIPDIKTRARRMARQVLLKEWLESRDPERIDMDEFLTFSITLSHPDMIALVENHAADIIPQLPALDRAQLIGCPEYPVADSPDIEFENREPENRESEAAGFDR